MPEQPSHENIFNSPVDRIHLVAAIGSFAAMGISETLGESRKAEEYGLIGIVFAGRLIVRGIRRAVYNHHE